MKYLLLTVIAAALILAGVARASTADTIRRVFEQRTQQAKCIAFAESSLRPDVTHINDDGSVDRGLFQINSTWVGKVVKYRTAARRVWIRVRAARLFDPLYNTRVAWAISHGGRAWGPWSSFTAHGDCR